MRTIAHNVRDLRDARGWSQERLAEAAKKHVNTVQKLEAAKAADTTTLEAVAAALGVDVERLLAPVGKASAEEVLQSFDAFLQSQIGIEADPTKEEKDVLRQGPWPFGAQTALGWYHTLQALRADRKRGNK